MNPDELGLPTIIVPYPGPSNEKNTQDIFVYLRPETNGALVESTILKVITSSNEYMNNMKLIYLANFPGEFIVKNSIVEQYYSLKLHFSVLGKQVFTTEMQKKFSDSFKEDFDDANIIGSFEALKLFNLEPEDLFNTWVPDKDVAIINGQCIKRIKDSFVVNYDIPALLHKNEQGTDIAVMMFRTRFPYKRVRTIVKEMHGALVESGIINPKFDASRAFHYSKSPFEQILDGIGYLYTSNIEMMGLADFTFAQYLLNHDISPKLICDILMNPICQIMEKDGTLVEESIQNYTMGYNYPQALDAVKRIISPIPLIHHGPLLQKLCCCFEEENEDD